MKKDELYTYLRVLNSSISRQELLKELEKEDYKVNYNSLNTLLNKLHKENKILFTEASKILAVDPIDIQRADLMSFIRDLTDEQKGELLFKYMAGINVLRTQPGFNKKLDELFYFHREYQQNKEVKIIECH